MTGRIALTLCWLLAAGACSPAPVSQVDPNSSTQVNNQIRPGSKGQRLELTDLDGEMVIPAGTSAYTIQSAQAAQSFALEHLLLAPAYAEEANNPDDEPIRDEQIRRLKASIAGQEIKLEILAIADTSEGSKIVSYRLKDLPITEENVIVEFSSPSGSFKLKGIFPKVSKNLSKQLTRVDIETTALVEAIETSPDRENNYSETEISHLLKTDTVQQIRDKIYEHFVKGERDKKFEDIIQAQARAILANSTLRLFLRQRQQCNKQRQCTQKPVLPASSERALPESLQAQIRQRVLKRLRNTANVNLALGIHPASEEERILLLKLGPIARRAACIERKISPCP